MSTELVATRADSQGHPYESYGVRSAFVRREDAYIILGEEAVFGVFDGAGDTPDARLAAQTAADFVDRAGYSSRHPEDERDIEVLTKEIKGTLQLASIGVKRATDVGVTTGTIVRAFPQVGQAANNRARAVWASAGDSRLYRLRGPNLWQVTTDESHGNFLLNGLGRDMVVSQCGHFAITGGDKLILVTDGITGNSEATRLTNQEIISACDTPNAQTAAQNLVTISRKLDDKTAIVVNI